MLTDFEDVCPRMDVLVDDRWARLGRRSRRPGPAPAWTDREVITMV